MEQNIGFKIIMELICPEMMDEKTFHDEFGCNAEAAYRLMSDNFSESPFNYCEDEQIVSIEVLGLIKEPSPGKVEVYNEILEFLESYEEFSQEGFSALDGVKEEIYAMLHREIGHKKRD